MTLHGDKLNLKRKNSENLNFHSHLTYALKTTADIWFFTWAKLKLHVFLRAVQLDLFIMVFAPYKLEITDNKTVKLVTTTSCCKFFH